MATSLYVHIPFCLKRCIYCDFVSGIYHPEKAETYIRALEQEILLIPQTIPLTTLYIGGGTPTALCHETLTKLIEYIFRHCQVAGSHEATIEANPGTLDKEKLHALRACGINRISIGIQSFDDEELALLGRIHSGEEAWRAVHRARDTGFENIGVDLIYGIPGQDMNSWKRTLEKTVSLNPNHISTYELTAEEGTVFYESLKSYPHPDSSVQKGITIPFSFGIESYRPSRGTAPGAWPVLSSSTATKDGGDRINKDVSKEAGRTPLEEEQIIEMYEYAIDYLASEGFIHYEISNFALPGYECKHNLNYWDRGEYIGVGLGAHSFLNSVRYHNTKNFERYLSDLSAGKNPVQETEHIPQDKALSEAIILGLRKINGIHLKSLSDLYHSNVVRLYQKVIHDLQTVRLLDFDEESLTLKLTRRGLLLSTEVCTRFI